MHTAAKGAVIPAYPEHPDEFLLESETNLPVDSSTLAGLGPRSLTPALDLLLIISTMPQNEDLLTSFIQSVESAVEPPFSVLLVYDREDGAALPVATEMAKTRPWLDLVPDAASAGHSMGLQAGFQAAGHGPAAVLSIDGSDDPRDLVRMRRLFAEGHRIVAASRDMRGGSRRGGTRFSRACGRLANRLVQRRLHLPLTDPTHAFRLYDAGLVNDLGIESRHLQDVPVELAVKALLHDVPIIEFPTIWTDHGSLRERTSRLLQLPGLLHRCRRFLNSADSHSEVSSPSSAPDR